MALAAELADLTTDDSNQPLKTVINLSPFLKTAQAAYRPLSALFDHSSTNRMHLTQVTHNMHPEIKKLPYPTKTKDNCYDVVSNLCRSPNRRILHLRRFRREDFR
ncbi:hypothetical protein P3692_26505, partial [Vibrio parahaemolyticus]|nr:hypothetical protein [Vibrio parahaemolyticus]